MATGYIWNGFGKFEERDGVKGITLYYAGQPWFLPYEQVTAIPNWTLREVDHDRSTPPLGEKGELVYQSVVVPGGRVVEELIDKQIPVSYAKMGIIRIEGKSLGRELTVACGADAEGRKLTTQIIEREATKSEIQTAKALAEQYKKDVVAEYFQSKRERMNGGRGRNIPDSTVRAYMEDLGVEDNDDITAHAKSAGVNPDLLKNILAEVLGAVTAQNQQIVAQAVVTAIKQTATSQGPNGSVQLNANKGKRSLGLAEHKEKYDAEHTEQVADVSAT